MGHLPMSVKLLQLWFLCKHFISGTWQAGGFPYSLRSEVMKDEQLAVLFAFETCPLCKVGVMAGKAVPEIERQALVQQNLQAIRGSNECSSSGPRKSGNEYPVTGFVTARLATARRMASCPTTRNGARSWGLLWWRELPGSSRLGWWSLELEPLLLET
jgi:hypothetical protein